MLKFGTIEALHDAEGTELGVSDWVCVTQENINVFAGVTRDHAAIHVEPAVGAASPFGGTIAHGLYTLSLGPALGYEIADFTACGQNLNYGYDKVRFPAPLPVGSRVRLRLKLESVAEVPDGAKVRLSQTFEREGHRTPVCVADGLLYIVR